MCTVPIQKEVAVEGDRKMREPVLDLAGRRVIIAAGT